MKRNDPYLAASWTDEQLQVLFDERKKYATLEQQLVADIKGYHKDYPKDVAIELARVYKPVLKDYQSYVKAATLLIDYFYGKGRFATSVPNDAFPDELSIYFEILICKVG